MNTESLVDMLYALLAMFLISLAFLTAKCLISAVAQTVAMRQKPRFYWKNVHWLIYITFAILLVEMQIILLFILYNTFGSLGYSEFGKVNFILTSGIFLNIMAFVKYYTKEIKFWRNA